jgi:hypothetical protein
MGNKSSTGFVGSERELEGQVGDIVCRLYSNKFGGS